MMQKFLEINKMKGLIWNALFRLELALAGLALFLFVFCLFVFCGFGKSPIRVQPMPLWHWRFTRERPRIQKHSPGGVNWLLLRSGLCIYSALCPSCITNLLHCHPSLLISSFFPGVWAVAHLACTNLPPLCFPLAGTTYSHECVCVIPPE